MKIFITAIGTDCGKTLVSSIITEALKADYWKPIQAGQPRDSEIVQSLISNSISTIHPESYLLQMPASPHASAKAEGVEIQLKNIIFPKTNNKLVIEGAGGALVPLNDKDFVIDLVPHLKASVILVSNLYLGSINHTLLTVEALKSRNIDVLGMIFNGPSNIESERIILHHSGYPLLLKIDQEPIINKEVVKRYAHIFIHNYERLYPSKR